MKMFKSFGNVNNMIVLSKLRYFQITYNNKFGFSNLYQNSNKLTHLSKSCKSIKEKKTTKSNTINNINKKGLNFISYSTFNFTTLNSRNNPISQSHTNKNNKNKNEDEDIDMDNLENFDFNETLDKSKNEDHTTNYNSEKHKSKEVAKISKDYFLKKYFGLIKKILNAMSELQIDNKKNIIEYNEKFITLRVTIDKVGFYIINKEDDQMLLTLTSPVSGFFKYKYDDDTGYWINVKDNHIIDELLVREFCKHSNGILNI